MSLGSNKTILHPYQRRWVNDRSRFALSVKSAQIGYSLGTAAWAVDRCLTNDRRTVVLLSRSHPQAIELAEKAKMWVDGYEGVIAEYFPNVAERIGDAEVLTQKITFPNKSRIIALAANPDTARGYTGDIVLDEFAFAENSEAIFKAAFRQTTLGFSMRVLSTPNGQQGKFYELAKQLGLDLGIRPPRQPISKNGWSGHWCDVHLAVKEGFTDLMGKAIEPEEIHRAASDEDTWLQEYCCQFISLAAQWFPPALYESVKSVDAGRVFDNAAQLATYLKSIHTGPELYGGWDIARKRDLSVIWLSAMLGDVTWERAILEMRNIPTPEQVREARALMPFLRRLNIDQSGMGLAIAEQLIGEFPGKVEGVTFTAAVKEQLAVLGKRRAEEGKVRLPDNDGVKASFTSMKKTVNAIGQARFDTEHDSKYGHGDHWWAYCLAEAAADQPATHLSEGTMAGTMRAPEMMPMERVSVF